MLEKVLLPGNEIPWHWSSPFLSSMALGIRSIALAGILVVNANTSDPAPRAVWQSVVNDFQKEHPEIRVKFNIYDQESYKKSIRNWLTGAAPDVVFWNVGYRMRQFVTPGPLENVSDLYADDMRQEFSNAAIDLVTVAGSQYGVPFSQYQIGLYHRRDLLQQVGFNEAPARWDDLMLACEKLKGAGITPIVIGSRDLWPTAAWFDYLDLRINGHAFHRALMDGNIPDVDQRVRAVFAKWRELLDKGCFVENHASMSWQESQALLYQGKGAMMLMGNSHRGEFPARAAGVHGLCPISCCR